MAVIVVPRFTKAQITAMLKARKKRISDAILMRLQLIGEQFVRNAREKANFTDRTGNLRNSIGYVVLHNGRQLFENFSSSGGDSGAGRRKKDGTYDRRFKSNKGKRDKKDEGPDKAKKVIREARKKFPTGYVLIGVAGMEYAAAVESKGYDVITSSSIEAEVALKKAIQTIQSKVGQIS